jgi:hypothetical protein
VHIPPRKKRRKFHGDQKKPQTNKYITYNEAMKPPTTKGVIETMNNNSFDNKFMELLTSSPKPTSKDRETMERWGMPQKDIELFMREFQPSEEQLKGLMALPTSEWEELFEIDVIDHYDQSVVVETVYDGYRWRTVANKSCGEIVEIEADGLEAEYITE